MASSSEAPLPTEGQPILRVLEGGLLENPWASIQFPSDLGVDVYPDRKSNVAIDGRFIEVSWTGIDGPREPKVRLVNYQSGETARIVEVSRPEQWGSDGRSLEQIEEYRTAMAAVLLASVHDREFLRTSPYTDVNRIEFRNLRGFQGEALATLGIPEACQRQDDLTLLGGGIDSLNGLEAIRTGSGTLSTTFTIDRSLIPSSTAEV